MNEQISLWRLLIRCALCRSRAGLETASCDGEADIEDERDKLGVRTFFFAGWFFNSAADSYEDKKSDETKLNKFKILVNF